MDWDWAVGGVTNETPRTMGPECENYLTNRRRWTEDVFFCSLFICSLIWITKRIEPINIPDSKETEKTLSTTRLILLLIMTFTFGIEMGFKLANRSVIFALNPCHIQTLVQIYLLAAKPNKLTITLFRIQMNNLNGPFLAFLFPEVECRTLPFEQATYWIQHTMLYIVPLYILRTGAYQVEDIKDYKWVIIGLQTQFIYHFGFLSRISKGTGINLNHMLCASESDPFQGDNYRIAAVTHQSILCPILNKLTVFIFSTPESIQHYGTKTQDIQIQHAANQIHQQKYAKLTTTTTTINQNHLPPNNSETTKKLRHRNINSLKYEELDLLEQREWNKQIEKNLEAIVKGEYRAKTVDLDMEVIDPSQTSAAVTNTVEYPMPTTKID